MKIINNEIEEYFSNMKRCSKCILPETFPGIEFDEGGVCNYCKTYEPMNTLGEDKFEKLLDNYRNKGDQYDIIVPISGGRDSAYVLHQIVKKYDMRTLTLTVDSGFIVEEGHRNLKAMTEKLSIPHVVLKNEDKIKISKRNAIIKFKGWIKKPSINTIVPVLNSGDKTMNLQMYNYAKENHIPIVLGGNIIGNASVEQDHWKTGYMGIFPDERGVYSPSDKYKLMFRFGIEFAKNLYNYRLTILNEYLWGSLTYLFDDRRKPKDIDSAGFYDYIYWNENKIIDTITKELDWKGASDTKTTWRIDDSAYPLINYLMYNIVGFTEHDEMYSKMTRENQITRRESIDRIKEDHKPRTKKLEETFQELNVTKEQVDKNLPKYRKKLLKKVLKKHHKNLEIV